MSHERQIAPLALNQLAAWQAWAREWPVSVMLRKTESGHRLGGGVIQWHLVCVPCQQTITVMQTETTPYLLTNQMMLDDTTRHIRNVHRDMEDAVYGGQSPKTAFGIGNPSLAHSGNPDTH